MSEDTGMLREFSLESIVDNLEEQAVDITDSRGNAFDDDVGSGVRRYIVSIEIFGDGVATTTVNLERVKEDDTYVMLKNGVSVSTAEKVTFTNNDPMKPVLVLRDGQNLSFISGEADRTPKASIQYWDR